MNKRYILPPISYFFSFQVFFFKVYSFILRERERVSGGGAERERETETETETENHRQALCCQPNAGLELMNREIIT